MYTQTSIDKKEIENKYILIKQKIVKVLFFCFEFEFIEE